MQEDGLITFAKNEPVTPVDDNDNNNTRTLDVVRKDIKKKKQFGTCKIRQAPPKHLTCQMCLTSFPTVDEVSIHVQTHYVDSILTPYLKLQRPYTCQACNSGIISKAKLIIHHRNHLNINPFICKHPGCGFVGKHMDGLRKHVVKHGGRAQVCEQCGRRYRRRWELRQHAARAHAAAQHHCRACSKHFRNALTYRAHLNYHRPANHLCPWAGCSKAYHSAAALSAHERAHADERVFRCHLCAAAAYTSQSLLNRHLRKHERDRLSKCDKCSATFEDYSAYYRHRVSSHGPWQPHRCPGCNKGYQSEITLEKHVQICEQAIRMQSTAADSDTKTDEITTSIQEMVQSDNKMYQLAEVSDDLSGKLKGQSLLVQPGNMSDLSKGLVLQELPADGLLYIEVEEEADEDRTNDSWRQ
ncbi:zinc finger protein 77-like isoform X2 [Pectinophora gossypiella]|nr:zinc finger protein 77-like isoform X2 [Pectinophora gossypiella]XP_049887955.1 zinc finger protein 77-like isoform X2 [Pectinophora gossypiella]